MANVYVEVYSVEEDEARVPAQSAVCLFLLSYLQSPPSVSLTLVLSECHERSSLAVGVGALHHRSVASHSLRPPVSDCCLPVFAAGDATSCVAGLCAVLRQVVKHSGEEWRHLLGFREGCLFACAEVSLWTKFCEIDMVEVMDQVLRDNRLFLQEVEVPQHLARLEEHLKQPVRMHNVDKQRKLTNCSSVDHDFAEGNAMSLADLVILPCVRVFLQRVSSASLAQALPLVLRWYQLVISQDHVLDALSVLREVPSQVGDHSTCVRYVLPQVPLHSLYKSDPKRYKPKSKIFTRQEDVEVALRVVEEVELQLDYEPVPFGHEVLLDWRSVPADVQPDVPKNRLARKRHQLENLAKAVIKVAKAGDRIVDFCCGSGHLGVVVAHCLPDCHIVMLDNKEESLARARAKVRQLALANVTVVQCNLHYFKGPFQVGMSLHACGIASDLVIDSSLQRNAAFVVCPCCYGSLQANHMVSYPRSRALSRLSLRLYLVLGHCADQTHGLEYAKSAQGERCMALVDADRCQRAREGGYEVSLAKLVPVTCSPKNNLLVGIPPSLRIL